MNIKPCPFCSSSRVKYSLKQKKNYYQASYYCADCNAYGPRILSDKYSEEAISYSLKCKVSKDVDLQARALAAWNNGGTAAVIKFADTLKEYYSAPKYQPTKTDPVKHTQIPMLMHRISEIKTSIINGDSAEIIKKKGKHHSCLGCKHFELTYQDEPCSFCTDAMMYK